MRPIDGGVWKGRQPEGLHLAVALFGGHSDPGLKASILEAHFSELEPTAPSPRTERLVFPLDHLRLTIFEARP